MQHYKTLKITNDATQREIEKAFKKIVILYHSKQGGDYKNFMKILESYSILRNKNKRRIYDMLENSVINKMGILDAILLVFTKKTAFFFSLCMFLQALAVYSFPICIFYKCQFYILPILILSQALMNVSLFARFDKIRNNTEMRNVILQIFLLLSIFHILFGSFILWLSLNVNMLYTLAIYVFFDAATTLAFYFNIKEKVVFIFSIYRIACIVCAFMVDSMNIKLFIMILYSIELGLVSWTWKSVLYIAMLVNYNLSVFFCAKRESKLLICFSCIMNCIFFLFKLICIFYRCAVNKRDINTANKRDKNSK